MTAGQHIAGHVNACGPRWGFIALAALCAVLGTWASVVTLRFFEHGALALEADTAARELASACALLLVVLEMTAFAVAAVLPREQLRAQRWALVALAGAALVFEAATIVLVQHGITRTADVSASASMQRAQDLRASVATLRATAEELRVAAAVSSRSVILASRQSAAESLGAALETERLVQTHTAELGELLAAQRPTVTQILGERGAVVYAVARGLLVSLGGLVLFGAAGALLRAARGGAAVPVFVAAGAVSEPAAHGVSGAAAAVSTATVPVHFGARFALAAAPLAACASVPMPSPVAGVSMGSTASAAPVPVTPCEAVAAAVPADPACAVFAVPVAAAAPVLEQHHRVNVSADAATSASTATVDERLERVRSGVAAGAIAPSIRGVQAAVRCGAPVARRYLTAMEAEGVIRRAGQGFELAPRSRGSTGPQVPREGPTRPHRNERATGRFRACAGHAERTDIVSSEGTVKQDRAGADTKARHVDPQAELRHQYRLACRHWRAAVQRLEDSGLSEDEAVEEAPDFDFETFRDLRCGARARSTGQPCRSLAIVFGNGRCKLHGGLSTGPVTDDGRARAALNGNQPKRHRSTAE